MRAEGARCQRQELEAYVTNAGFTDVRVRTGGLWVTVVGRPPAV